MITANSFHLIMDKIHKSVPSVKELTDINSSTCRFF